MKLPSVPLGGQPSANGYLVLGIGTRDNNQPSDVTAYPADSTTGEILTLFSGKSYRSFLDTGSNGYAFPAPAGSGLAVCEGGGVQAPTFPYISVFGFFAKCRESDEYVQR